MWIFPILCWILLLLFLLKRGAVWRVAFVSASVIWGCLVSVFTEVLSLFQGITAINILLCWVAACSIALALYFQTNKPSHVTVNGPLSTFEIRIVVAVALIGLTTFVTAIIAPPNNYDSMVYHMSRVVHWLQNRTVAHYPTHILRQIELSPWAEFAITHFQALSGNDRFANLVQWFSMIGSVIGGSLIAKHLWSSRTAQFVTAAVIATIPMGIVQASSTQNDYVVAFWLMCFIWSGMRFGEEPLLKWALLAGASLGLAINTKGTAYLYALPFLSWFIFETLRKTIPLRQILKVFLSAMLIFLALNIGHYGRNFTTFSNPLLSGESPRYSNEIFSPNVALSNLIRNISVHAGTPFSSLNERIEDGVRTIHSVTSLDINDPRITFADTKFKIHHLSTHEDRSQNLLHVLLAIIVLGILAFRNDIRNLSSDMKPYVFALTAGFLIFCGAMKWQPWNSRLHLPLFIIGAPVIGTVITRIARKKMIAIVSAILFTASLPWLVWNASRPLVPIPEKVLAHYGMDEQIKQTIFSADRDMYYFKNTPGLWKSYLHASQVLINSGAKCIGIERSISNTEIEYPLWALLGYRSGTGIRIEHINVENSSGTIRIEDFQPDVIVGFNQTGEPIINEGNEEVMEDGSYRRRSIVSEESCQERTSLRENDIP